MRKAFLKLLSVMIILSMILCGLTFAGDSSEEVDTSLITGPNMIDLLDHYNPFEGLSTVEEIFDAATASTRFMSQYGELINAESLKAYKKVVNAEKRTPSLEGAQKILDAFNDLVQDYPIGERLIYLWGDQNESMPFTEGEGSPVTTGGFMVFYPAEDPAQAKGNVLLCSGGEGTTSCTVESYPTAERFRELGYNCFVFQVRSADCAALDSTIDVQRALKMVRYLAETNGYGGADLIVGNGFSAGNLRIMSVLTSMTAREDASKFVPDYTPDEIDTYSSDMDVYLNIYGGPLNPLPDDLPYMPALFLCSGSEDDTGATPRLEDMYEQFKDRVPARILVIEGAGHGFGDGYPGKGGYVEGCEIWTTEADAFMQEHIGFSQSQES